MKLIISESKTFIIITAALEDGKVLSWENLQEIKDTFYPEFDFFEIYPKKEEVINKANERHLICHKEMDLPKMGDFEESADIRFVEEFYLKKDVEFELKYLANKAKNIQERSRLYKEDKDQFRLLEGIWII